MNPKPLALGLDPGFASFGWALLELGRDSSEDRVEAAGVVRTESSVKKSRVRACDDRSERCRTLAAELAPHFRNPRVLVVCTEAQVFHPKTGWSAKVLSGWACGATAALSVAVRDLPLLQATPQEIKKALLGTGAGDKEMVKRALDGKFGAANLEVVLVDVTASERNHAYDAIAAVVACSDTDVIRMVRQWTP